MQNNTLNGPIEKISMDKTDILYIKDNLAILIGMWIEENYSTKTDEEKIEMFKSIKEEIQIWIDGILDENSTIEYLKKIRAIEYKYHDIIDFKQERSVYSKKIQNTKTKADEIIRH